MESRISRCLHIQAEAVHTWRTQELGAAEGGKAERDGTAKQNSQVMTSE